MLSGSVRQRLDPLDSQCSNAHMLTVAAKGSFDWRVVGRRLLPDSYQIIEDIELEYKNEQSKRDKMFKKWKEMKGSGATYRGLMAVFKELDNQEAAEMVKNLVAEAQQDQQVAVNIQTVSDLNEAQQDQQAAADVQAVRNSQSPPTVSVNDKHFIKDNCGCGGCNFEGLVINGCPNPLRQQFLYLNTAILTKNEENILLLKLKADAEAIDEKHRHIALKFEVWMKENVTVEQYRQILLKLQGSMRKDVPMLKDRCNEIRRADHAHCSAILSYYYTWFNCSVLKQVLEDAKILTYKDPKEILSSLKSYTEEVLKYCKRNIFECPPPSSVSPTKKSTYFLLKLQTHQIFDKETFTAEEIRLFEATLMTSLNIREYVLTLHTFTKGCVELVYSVPLCIYSILFPLNKEQWRHLITLGVTEIKTKDYHYKIEHPTFVAPPSQDGCKDNAKNELQEMGQKQPGHPNPCYDLISQEGPPHQPIFRVKVTAPRSGEELVEEGLGNPRKVIHVQGKNQPPLPLASKGYIYSSHVESSATCTTTLILLISNLAIWGVIISYLTLHLNIFTNDAYQWNTGDVQNFSCDPSLSKPLCPGTIARCTCMVRGTTSYTRWNFKNQTVCSDNFIELAQIHTYSMDNGTCGPYLNASNTGPDGGYCNTSILVITANVNLNGLVIECLDLNRTTTPQLVGNITVLVTNVTGIPGTPMVDVSAESDKITVTWTPPNTGGVPSSYNVSISDGSIPVVIPDNGSALYTHTFAGLTNDTLYTISVVAINCLGSKIASKTIQTSPAVLPASSKNLPLLAATPTGIIIAASVVVLIIFGSICITIYLCKKRDKKNKEYKCQDKELNQKVSCLRRVFCDGDDTPDATPDSVKTHELNITPAICASTSFTTRDAKATPPTDTTNQAPTIQETSPNAPSCTTGYCFRSSRVEEDGDDTLNTAPESTELHILNTTPAVRANTSSSTGYKKAISEAHRGDMRNKNGRVDTDGDDTHITTPHKYASIKPQIGGKRTDRRVETDSPDEIGVVPTHPYNLRQRILRNEVQ